VLIGAGGLLHHNPDGSIARGDRCSTAELQAEIDRLELAKSERVASEDYLAANGLKEEIARLTASMAVPGTQAGFFSVTYGSLLPHTDLSFTFDVASGHGAPSRTLPVQVVVRYTLESGEVRVRCLTRALTVTRTCALDLCAPHGANRKGVGEPRRVRSGRALIRLRRVHAAKGCPVGAGWKLHGRAPVPLQHDAAAAKVKRGRRGRRSG
jgi:hypothetical protein